MFGFDRAEQFRFPPNQRSKRFLRRIKSAFTQDNRRNIRPVKARKLDPVNRVRPPSLPDKHIIQLAAIATDDRLNLAMPAAVRTAGNFRAVMALRTFEEVRFAHAIVILLRVNKFKLPSHVPR